MKAVVIRISCDYDFRVAQAFNIVFDAQGHHHIIKLGIFIYLGPFFAVHVFGFSS